MPHPLPTQEQSPRTWWNLARSPSTKDLRNAYAHEKPASRPALPAKSGKLTSFASAIGLKPKKLSPSLAIEDPPATLVQYVSNSVSTPASPASSANRPPSKSVSSSRSRVDSIEPRTPVDSHRDHRHSLLTLSDTDPFAGRPMIAVPVPQMPHLPSDPNRLSAYSNPSIHEFVQKKADVPTFNRVSYASSSSNSNYHTLDIPPSPVPTKLPELRQLKAKRSAGSLQFKRQPPPEPLHRQTSVTPSMTSGSSHSKASSSSTVVASQRQSHPDPAGPARPKLRIRGMTESGPSTRGGFFTDERSSLRKTASEAPSAYEPLRVVKRQPSNSRIQPPTAPPKQQLPAPPSSASSFSSVPFNPDIEPVQQRRGGRASASSSSSLSFASSDSITGYPYGVADRDKRSSQRDFAYEPDSPISFVTPNELKTAPSSPRTLRKAVSHQSLTRIGLASPPRRASPPPDLPPASNCLSEKAMRKQRSFHHPRLPIPAIPLPSRTSSLANSKAFPTSNIPESVMSMEKRRGSTATSISSRRRLFSNSSRPTTSHHPPTTPEDDTLSVFSLRSDTDSHLTPYKPWINRDRQPLPSSSSFWEEGGSDAMPSSPVRSNAESYMPQAIMSRAELAQLEASVDSRSIERSTRPRGYSIMSASTVLSDTTQESDVIPIGLSPPPVASSRPSSKQTSMRMSGTPASPASSSSRPQSAVSSKEHHSGPSLASTVQIASRVALPEITSLPPPPRRRKPTLTVDPGPSSSGSSSSRPTSAHSPALRPGSAHSPMMRPGSSHSPSMRPASAHTPAPRPGSAFSSKAPVPIFTTTTPLRTSPTVSPMPSRASSVKKPHSMRSKFSVEKNLHRQSIMRKPSFLEIDDDTDMESDSADIMDGRVSGSFLDLARESFDTARTDR